MRKHLKAQGPYSLKAVVFSHGWSSLAPFQVLGDDGTTSVLVRGKRRIHSLRVSPTKSGVSIQSSSQISDDVVSKVRWMFRLDDNVNPLYAYCKEQGRAWVEKNHMGRMLRAETVFEDLIKLILTTNCSWKLTEIMTQRLADQLGEADKDGRKMFPTPQAFAKKSEKFYRGKIRTGYRSPYLSSIGKAVASGKLDPERWKDPAIDTETLRKEILAVPGAGPYVAENLLRFLGRTQSLGLDSWARGKLKKMWKMKKLPSDKTIERKYKVHGDYRGIILWCDLTRDWFESSEFNNWTSLE